VRHALAVLAGIAVGLPVMAALASASGHAAGGLPDRYVPWAHQPRPGYAAIRAPVRAVPAVEPRRPRAPVTTAPAVTPAVTPMAVPRRTLAVRRPVRHAGSGAGLRVSIDAPRTARPGGTYAYRIRLANRGPGTPGEVTVHNTLPAGVVRTGTSLSDGVGGYAGGRDTTLVLPRLGPGRSATARFVVRVRRGAHGELVARTRIASVDGARVPASGGSVAQAATLVR
jgi:uncharacterized repeat protein (TIGR01451 family)